MTILSVPTPPTAPSLEPLAYLQQFRLLVCKECRFACLAKEVATHLQTRHKSLSPAVRRRIAEDSAQLPSVIQTQAELAELQLPPPSSPPVPLIHPPESDGLRCPKCSYIARQTKKIKEHLRKAHGWRNPQGTGRPSLHIQGTGSRTGGGSDDEGDREQPWVEGVYCQRFFVSRAGSSWFEVCRGRKPKKTAAASCGNQPRGQATRLSLTTPGRTGQLGHGAQSQLNLVVAQEEAIITGETVPQPQRQQGLATCGQTFSETDAWIRRTGWPTIYPAAHRRLLLDMSRPPNARHGHGENEHKPSCLMDALDDMFDRCEQTIRHSSRFILCWLRSFDHDRCSRAPFSLVAKKASVASYRRIWKRCLAFVVRRWLLGQDQVSDLPNPGSSLIWQQVSELWGHRV